MKTPSAKSFAISRFSIALLLMATSAMTYADTTDLLTVDRAVLADAVDSASHGFLHALASPLTRKKASLWMQLRGTPDLLDKLKAANGKLTLHHVWRKYVFSGVETRLDQPLNIGREGDLVRLSEQVAVNGYFTWRTWSDKLNLSSGNWRVDLELDGHVPVMCQTDGDEPQPCSYPFEVE